MHGKRINIIDIYAFTMHNIEMDKSTLETIISDQLAEFLSFPTETIVRQTTNLKLDIKAISKYKEAIIILGVRRCGKSFLMKLIAKELAESAQIFYLDLDDPRLISFQANDFQLAYEIWLKSAININKPSHLFIDEPQNVAGWERWVTFFSKQRNCHVIITGSNSTMLGSSLATHLTGRHREFNLFPLSFSEVLNSSKLALFNESSTSIKKAKIAALLDNYFKYGGMPRAFLDCDRALLIQYYKDIVIKDIAPTRSGAKIRELIELGNFLMSNNTKLVNKSKLAKQLGFKQQRTITHYIQGFLDCFLFYEIKKFNASVRKQARSLPKYYCVDPAMAGVLGFTVLENKSSSLENYVFLELKRRGYEVFYWTSKEGWEVDFLARKHGEKTLAVQVCLDLSNKEIIERETRVITSLAKEMKIRELLIVTLEPYRAGGIDKNIRIEQFEEWARN